MPFLTLWLIVYLFFTIIREFAGEKLLNQSELKNGNEKFSNFGYGVFQKFVESLNTSDCLQFYL